MATRQKLIPDAVKEEILLKSKRRCPVCFSIGLIDPQPGGIVQIDRDRANVESDNLVFLCSKHHALFDRDQVSSKEVRSARTVLYGALASEESPSFSHLENPGFEEKVTSYVRSQFQQKFGDVFMLQRNALYPGRSGVSHEVDLAAVFSVAGIRYLTVFEIKNRRSQLGAQEVLEFSAKTKDIRADKAILVCGAGFSASALRLAADQGIGLIEIDKAGSLREVRTEAS